MIKRITNPAEFEKLLDDMSDLFEYENENEGHYFLKHNKEHIANTFSHKHLLAWDFFRLGKLKRAS